MSANTYSVQVQIAPIICFRCRKQIKVVRGYVYDEAFVPLIDVSDHRRMTALVDDLRKRDPAITPVGLNDSKTVRQKYFTATCPQYSMLCGDFFTTHEFFTDKALCDFSSCQLLAQTTHDYTFMKKGGKPALEHARQGVARVKLDTDQPSMLPAQHAGHRAHFLQQTH
jgi:hypothetical protein